MEIFSLIFISSVSILFGVILTIILQYYVLLKYFNKSSNSEPPRKTIEACSLPEALKKQIENVEANNTGAANSSIAISLLLQFLFHELRHSESIKRWLYKKLSLEFDELLAKTTTGKFFDAVTIHDMNLGSQFPDITDINIAGVKLNESQGFIDTLNLSVKLEYTGNFMLSVNAKMKFGKSAFLSIKVKKVSGLARLQFTRIPYTHWSFSFYNEPIIELAVESQFHGRQLQSNVTNLIINQIKKAIKRKHTLPNYKMRYKPFFFKTDPGHLDNEDFEVSLEGILQMTCLEVTRLTDLSQNILTVYFTFTLDSSPYVCLFEENDVYYVIMDVAITKHRQQQLGVIFKQEQGAQYGEEPHCASNHCQQHVSVETVVQNGPAAAAGLKSGDWILSVDSKPVANMAQIAKTVKAVHATTFSMRIKRATDAYAFKPKCAEESGGAAAAAASNATVATAGAAVVKTDEKAVEAITLIGSAATNAASAAAAAADNADKEKEEIKKTPNKQRLSTEKLPKLISSSENVSKLAQTLGNFTLRKRKTSLDRASSESSNRSTPSSVSSPSTPQHFKLQSASFTNMLPTAIKKQTSSDSKSSEAASASAANAEPHSAAVNQEQPLQTAASEEPTQVNVVHATEANKTGCYCFESTVPVNDQYSFPLRDGQKYLNVNAWGQDEANKDVLLGYANVPLVHVLNECCNSFLGHFTNCYSFLPPNATTPSTSQTHPLLTHSGFEHVFCYGDILLSFEWKHEGTPSVKRKDSNVDDIEFIKDIPTNVETKHDFIRTVFHRTTHCDFCSKKIWLKDAVQCRHCAMCCHKKCISKCQMGTTCVSADVTIRSESSSDFGQPEITMTEPLDEFSLQPDIYGNDNVYSTGQSTPKTPFGSTNSLKRVNSANNLTIPGGRVSQCQSRSLPQTPQHTPGRKQSIVINANPFLLCPGLLEMCYQQPSEPETIESITQILDNLLQCSHDENLMDTAKNSGKELYTDIPHEIRFEKINIMVTELKKLLDSITAEHIELSKQLNREESETEKARLAFLVGQMDAKVHALSILMLHYCSGLQQAQDKII